MRFSELKQQIPKHTWWLEEAPMVLQTVLWAWHGFIEQYRYGHPKYLTFGLFFQKGQYGYEFTPRDEKEAAWRHMRQQLERQPAYFINLYKRWKVLRKDVLRAARDIEKQRNTNFDLTRNGKNFLKFLTLYKQVMTPSVIIENADVYTDREIFEETEKRVRGLALALVQPFVFAMTAPLGHGYIERERMAILEAVIEHKKALVKKDAANFAGLQSIDPDLAKRCQEISKRYFWIRNNYCHVERLGPEMFWKQMRKEAKRGLPDLRKELRNLKNKPADAMRRQRTLRKKYEIPGDLLRVYGVLSMFTLWQDERKELGMIVSRIIHGFWEKVSERTGLAHADLLNLGWEEMERFLAHQEFPTRASLRERRKFSAYVTYRQGKSSKGAMITGAQARLLFASLMRQLHSNEELRGVVASAPRHALRGRVQIVTDVRKQKFLAGRILVTSMTRPEFMPYLRKAIGIITDEGGVTAHAAIVARELLIPCIIGTKGATRALKDGDRVEMDLVSGGVRVIQR
ncbi:MAG: PEP-utilizing enzyme [bacterium]|nr:PEP-utilizing enzyme [bacterium]